MKIRRPGGDETLVKKSQTWRPGASMRIEESRAGCGGHCGFLPTSTVFCQGSPVFSPIRIVDIGERLFEGLFPSASGHDERSVTLWRLRFSALQRVRVTVAGFSDSTSSFEFLGRYVRDTEGAPASPAIDPDLIQGLRKEVLPPH
jgi:hypothetical protein